MKPIDDLDTATAQKISKQRHKMNHLIALAELYEKNNQHFEALLRYQEAQNHTLDIGDGPKITVLIEEIDNRNWHKINDKINELEIKIELNELRESNLNSKIKGEKIIQLKQKAWRLFEKTFQREKFYTENDMKIKRQRLTEYEKVKEEWIKWLSSRKA